VEGTFTRACSKNRELNPAETSLRSSRLFSSHFSRTLITDLHSNHCEDIPTVHHREVRQSPETIAFSDENFRALCLANAFYAWRSGGLILEKLIGF
jgi:hypothetical protein